MVSDKKTHEAFPSFIYRPQMLGWFHVLPQIILLLLNLHVLWIVFAEEQVDLAQVKILFAVEVFLLFLSGVVWKWVASKKTMPAPAALVLLLGQIGYLWLFMHKQEFFIPWQIEPWIVDRELVILSQFTFMMPGIFYAFLRLASFRLKLPFSTDIGLSVSTVIGVPVVFYIFLQAFGVFRILPESSFWIWFYQLFFIVATVVVFLALLRLMVMLFHVIHQNVWSTNLDYVFTLMVGVIGPIGGLCLNQNIPFPASFQAPIIYILALLNGLILMIPTLKQKNALMGTLYLRVLFYPFSCYFFIVFLPFLPLSLPAMLAMGLGFLILVPFILFIIHTKRISYDIRALRTFISTVKIVILMGSALIIMPGIFLNNAYHDRQSLRQAIDYVYTPDYQTATRFEGSVGHVRQTLKNLNNVKKGIQLPYLSGIYNEIVFDGMVLPDSKIAYLYKLFSGEALPEVSPLAGGSLWGRGRWGAGRRTPPPMTLDAVMSKEETGPAISPVTLQDINLKHKDHGEMMSSTIHFTMKNETNQDNMEYFTSIKIPEAVLIEDYQLKVGEEMVPGRIFEKKTAMWVYHMIRDFTRRDPGILVYQSPGVIDFRVYPFRRAEVREASLSLLYPKAIQPKIQIGDQEISLEQQTSSESRALLVNPRDSHFHYAVIPAQSLGQLPAWTRVPYLHFILDFGLSQRDVIKEYPQRMQAVIDQFSDIKEIKMTAANYESEDLIDYPAPAHDRKKRIEALKRCSLSGQGSLDLNRVLKKIFLDYQTQMVIDSTFPKGQRPLWQKYPIFVVLSDQPTSVLFKHDDLAYFRYLLPELNYFYFFPRSGGLERINLWRDEALQDKQDVVAIKRGTRIALVARDESQPGLAVHPLPKDMGGRDSLEIIDPGNGRFRELDEGYREISSSSYTQGLDLVLNSYYALQHPFKVDMPGNILEQSRKLNIMTPLTSFIVVEREAQWKTLALKEKQKMRAHQAFDFEDDFDTPAPAFLLLFVFLIGGVLVIQKYVPRLQRKIFK